MSHLTRSGEWQENITPHDIFFQKNEFKKEIKTVSSPETAVLFLFPKFAHVNLNAGPFRWIFSFN